MSDPSCIHDFGGPAACLTCGTPAVPMLLEEVRRLDGATRAAVGFLVLGDMKRAEKLLREAGLATPMFGRQLGLFEDQAGATPQERATR